MFFLPLYHNLNNAECLVIGAGATAVRKLKWLVRAGANITVVAERVGPQVQAMADEGKLALHQKRYSADQISPQIRLIISATNDAKVNQEISTRAQTLGILVNCVDQPELCTVIFPAIVDRAPILVAISSMGVAPTLSRVVRGWLEARLPKKLNRVAELAQSLRDDVKRRLPSVDARKNYWEKLFGGPIAEQAMSGSLDDSRLRAIELLDSEVAQVANDGLDANASEARIGSVALVGAGPGDPELITLKALRLLQAAEVVLYDKLANPEILEYARRDAEFVYVGKQGPRPELNEVSSSTRPDNRSHQQSSINQKIIDYALAGRQVVRLKGGDPFIYGRGGEELAEIAERGIDVMVVPGITAAMGAASYAGIPLTYRNLSLSVRFVTGHRIENAINLDWPELGRADQTLVIYMGLVGLAEIMAKIAEHTDDRERPVAIVENATYPEQKVVRGTLLTIADLAKTHEITGPSVVIVGAVVGLSLPR